MGNRSASILESFFFFFTRKQKLSIIDKIKKNSIEENVFQKGITEFEALIVE